MERHAHIIGVSPAYFVSRYGDRFNAYQMADAMADIASLGYTGFQLEVYHPESLPHWLSEGAGYIRQRSQDAGLQVSQFVAHFMMETFSSSSRLKAGTAGEQMAQVIEIVSRFEECRVITVPIGPFEADCRVSCEDHQRLMDDFADTIRRLLDQVEAVGCRLALETIPGGLIDGTEGFLRLCERLESPHLGFNLDTGHAWASKENIYLIPARLGSRIVGTHICDNLGHENVSLRPGAGTIDWSKMVSALQASGYAGAYDLEIICPSEDVQFEYRDGKTVIETLLRPEAAAA